MFKTIIPIYILISLFVVPATVSAQTTDPVFDASLIPDIYISIHPDSLAQIFEWENRESDHEFPATFVFSSPARTDTVENVGFRLRGNTSRNAAKKSFKVSFNTFERGRKYYGLEKLNLKAEQNDPSLIRSKLSFDIFKKMRVDATRAGYVRLFINADYMGLYLNVEHIDENYVQSRFGNNDGNLFKCLWPADLAYIDNNPESYKFIIGDRRTYDLKTNDEEDDYSDISAFITKLNLTPNVLFEEVFSEAFEVNTFLRYLAVDVAVGSWDDYWFLKNNYYLYHNPETDKWQFIPYDYDNTFGIDWVGGDWGTRPIYDWGNSEEARPLVTKILSVQKFRDRYSYYLNQLLNTAFHPDTLFPRIDEIHNLITDAAEADYYRTLDYCFDVDDFHNSYTMPLNGQFHGGDCDTLPEIRHLPYGLKPYIETRRNNAFAQLELNDISPILETLTYHPAHPQVGDEVVVRIRVEDEDPAPEVLVQFDFEGQSGQAVMHDDGRHDDGRAGDLIYAGVIPGQPGNGTLSFYVQATDNVGNSDTFPLKGQQNKIELQVGYDVPGLFINEFMASNDSTIPDNAGGYADWVEIYNGDSVAIWLGDKFLTDNLGNPDKWAFPDTTLESGAVLLIWADDDTEQGRLHTNYKLNAGGEQLGIFRQEDESFLPVDTLSFGHQETDISFGRNPDGSTNWEFFENPTPGKLNALPVAVDEHAIQKPTKFKLAQNYPNPFNPVTKISYELQEAGKVALKIYNILGTEIATIVNEEQAAGLYAVNFNAVALVSGVYFYVLEVNNKSVDTKKMMLLR